MATRSSLDTMFGHDHALDILLYIADHPGCMKSDIYREVTRNQSTSQRIDNLSESGLVEKMAAGTSIRLFPTDSGERVASLLREADRLIEEA